MSKFHINNNGEVKPCSASVVECQFSNVEGSTNHFDNVEEAEQEAQRRNKERYGAVFTHTKNAVRDKVEHAPRVVKNAVSKEELKRIKDEKNSSFLSYDEIISIGENYQADDEVDQEVSYMLSEIAGHSPSDKMSDAGITDFLFGRENDGSPAEVEAAKKVWKLLKKQK